ncbi:serpin family protein [Azotosporobacter soli]|uniref:serpin family protein n=1 Tax=Azotosporobacter soli TaxID=3055040 RepID=UPI0031FE8564
MINEYCGRKAKWIGLCLSALLLIVTGIAGAGVPAEKDNNTAEGNNQFAVDLYQRIQLAQPDKNTFYSPLGVSTALVMTYAGSRGQTEAQMAKALHFTGPQDELHQKFSNLLTQLQTGKDKGYRLEIANALWGQKGFSFSEPFLSLTDRYYQGSFQTLDFAKDTENSRMTINHWVEERTDNKIKNLLQQGDLTYLTRLVLTNAIYFKGDWEKPFKAEATSNQPFRLADGSKIDAALMRQSDTFAYAESEGVQAVELPYAGDDVAMLVLLPNGSAADLARNLSPEQIRTLRAQMTMKQVEVSLPKFKFATRYYLDDEKLLPALGMADAFDQYKADLSGMDGRKDLYISHVIHQAMIEVNEKGSEAAAATAVVVGLKSFLPQQPTIFRADHPFLFLIVHKPTDSILFMGAVNDPSKS